MNALPGDGDSGSLEEKPRSCSELAPGDCGSKKDGMTKREILRVDTSGRGTIELTFEVARVVAASGVTVGIVQVFARHTSASLMLTENADPDVRRDIESFLARMAPDGDPGYAHTSEGPDDMSAHLRTLLCGAGATLPVSGGRLDLGTWQGIFLYEHRAGRHGREVVVTVIGDS